MVGSKKTGGKPDVGSSLPSPGLIPNQSTDQKESHGARHWWALAVFLLKNVDFEFPVCYRSFRPILIQEYLLWTRLLSRNSEVPKMGLKGLKCLPLHNENQGNGENKPPSRIYIFSLKYLCFIFVYMAMLGFSWNMWNLVPGLGIKPRPPALGAQSLKHQTTREVPVPVLLYELFISWKCVVSVRTHPMWVVVADFNAQVMEIFNPLENEGNAGT